MGEFRKRTQNTPVFTGMSYLGFCNALYSCLPLLATTLFCVQKLRAILQIVVVFEIGLRYGRLSSNRFSSTRLLCPAFY